MIKNHDAQRLPSLRSLQVFEVAARHESFTRAAQELHLTQGAVSRQVQELESWLSRDLFARHGPNVTVTAGGRVLGAEVRRAMDILARAIAEVMPQSSDGAQRVTLSMLPSVATKWLAPRLSKFLQEHSDLDLRITASRHLVDFQIDEIDAAIRYGEGSWKNLRALLLAEETVFPVCTSAFADAHQLRLPADLLGVTLLHSDIEQDWRAWFRLAGLGDVKVPRGPTLADDAAMLQAAIDGQGIALGRSVLVADDLRNRRLIAPFPMRLKATYSYWFVTPVDMPVRPEVATVCDWLVAEFAQIDL